MQIDSSSPNLPLPSPYINSPSPAPPPRFPPSCLLDLPPSFSMDFLAKPPHGSSPSPPSTAVSSSSSSSSSSPSSSSPCAACKLLRRRCVENCIFAPHFPADDPLKFACVHRVFGASNVSKMLQEVTMEQRGDAVSSLVYEANARIRDPVYGCVGAIANLQRQVLQLQTQLAVSQAQSVYAQLQCQILISKSSATTSSSSSSSQPNTTITLLNSSLNINNSNNTNTNTIVNTCNGYIDSNHHDSKNENQNRVDIDNSADDIINAINISNFGPNDANNDMDFLNQPNILSSMEDDSSVLMSPTTPSTHNNHLFHSLHHRSPPTPLLSNHYSHHLPFDNPAIDSNSFDN